MQTDFVKVALMAAWVGAIGTVGYVSRTASVGGWTLLAVVSLVPLVWMVRLWSAPSQSMSESTALHQARSSHTAQFTCAAVYTSAQTLT